MTIYSRKPFDWNDPIDRAACYRQWITHCWQEIPFTAFLPDDRLYFTFTRRNLPSLSGLYAVSARLYPNHLDLPLVRRRDKALKISECLPEWMTLEHLAKGFDQMLYVGESENLFDRWSGHDKMVEFKLFLNHSIPMKLRFFAEPPLTEKQDSYRFTAEKQIVKDLCPLLNFH